MSSVSVRIRNSLKTLNYLGFLKSIFLKSKSQIHVFLYLLVWRALLGEGGLYICIAADAAGSWVWVWAAVICAGLKIFLSCLYNKKLERKKRKIRKAIKFTLALFHRVVIRAKQLEVQCMNMNTSIYLVFSLLVGDVTSYLRSQTLCSGA